ncbi:ribbon-helix-helix protein, CopG family [Candidatus Woesearchaeota archaeon]|nr:ribbon-helix-helix protein, CopG family [Candidatus Woesearchaeota archaeon]
MDTLQIRLSHPLVEKVDRLVESGLYASRSDAVRDAVRRLALQNMIGSIPNKGDSVKEVKIIRKRLSKEKFDMSKLNKL